MSAHIERIGSGDISHRAAAVGRINDSVAWSSLCCGRESVFCAAGEIIVLRVGGEVDLCTLPILQAALGAGLDRRPAHLLVDLAGVTFCSAQGLDLLIQIGRTAAEKAVSFAVVGVPPQLYRVWTLLGDGDLSIRHPTIDSAMTAIHGRRLRLNSAASATCSTIAVNEPGELS